MGKVKSMGLFDFVNIDSYRTIAYNNAVTIPLHGVVSLDGSTILSQSGSIFDFGLLTQSMYKGYMNILNQISDITFTPCASPSTSTSNPGDIYNNTIDNTGIDTNNSSNGNTGILQKMISFAKQFVGKTQSQMRQIMKNAGYNFHNRLWCADFVSYITGKAVGESNLPEWYKKCNRSYVPSIEKEARKHGAIVSERHGSHIDTSKVKPGHYAIFNWQRDNSRVDHIGYVTRIEGNKVYTLEGNTGAGRNSESKVQEKVRDLGLVHSFVNIS